MAFNKTLLSGSISLLILKLLEEQDMYGYQMIETLRERSDHTFDMKAGTLYPLLHTLEQKGFVEAHEDTQSARPRRYYHLTDHGRRQLVDQEAEFRTYANTVLRILDGGACFA